jgi:hypothetical protein
MSWWESTRKSGDRHKVPILFFLTFRMICEFVRVGDFCFCVGERFVCVRVLRDSKNWDTILPNYRIIC